MDWRWVMLLRMIFLVIFVPVHSAIELALIHRLYNPPSNPVLSHVWRTLGVVVTMPVLLPMMLADPDGDRFPRWVQWASVPVNSLVWGVLILLAAAAVRRLWLRCHGE
jgi:hypothetical protein